MTIRNRITVNGKTEYAYRVIMEKHIGRKLKPGECVHHKDGNPLNDSIEKSSSHIDSYNADLTYTAPK